MISSAAARPPAPTPPAVPIREKSEPQTLARTADPARATAADAATDGVAEQKKASRQAAKDQAKAQVMQLIERMKTIKQFASDNPEVMAKLLAQVAKELKAAVKAYAAAGGSAGGWQTSLSTATPAAPGEPEKDVYQKMKEEVSGSEAASDMDFLKNAKGIAATIKEFLTKAKIQTALAGPDKETKDAFDATDADLKEIDDAMAKMDRDIRASSPAAGMFVALYA